MVMSPPVPEVPDAAGEAGTVAEEAAVELAAPVAAAVGVLSESSSSLHATAANSIEITHAAAMYRINPVLLAMPG